MLMEVVAFALGVTVGVMAKEQIMKVVPVVKNAFFKVKAMVTRK